MSLKPNAVFVSLLALTAIGAGAQDVVRPVIRLQVMPGVSGAAAMPAAAPSALAPAAGSLALSLSLPRPIVQAGPAPSKAALGLPNVAGGGVAQPNALAIAAQGNVRRLGLATAVGRAREADSVSGGVVERGRVLDGFFDQRAAAPTAAAVPHSRFLDELEAPGKVLGDQGIARTVTVYGSARLIDPSRAQERLASAKAAARAKRKDRAARAAVLEAHRVAEMSQYYEEARRFGSLVAERTKGRVAVVTGGGGGIMEAANRGAREAGGPSVGYNIQLPFEQAINSYVSPGMSYEFHDFATRKKGLRHASDALVFFPGGFGTMDELFEVLTLIQTGKLPRVPVILVGGTKFWKHVVNVRALARRGVISRGDLELISFVETSEEAWDRVAKNYPDRPEYN